MKKGILSCVTADVDLEMENQDVYVWKQKKSFIFEHNSREICDRGKGKELRQKHNADLEVPKYLKQKETNISKANKKSKHKHQYEECLIRYKWNWEENKIHTSLNSYCIICGKINDRMKNSIVTDYMKKVDTPMGKRYIRISEDTLYEKYHNRLPVFFVEDICKDKYLEVL